MLRAMVSDGLLNLARSNAEKGNAMGPGEGGRGILLKTDRCGWDVGQKEFVSNIAGPGNVHSYCFFFAPTPRG